MTEESKQLTAIQSIRSNLKKMEPEFKLVLPPNVTSDKFVRIVLNALQKNQIEHNNNPRIPNLLTLDRHSFYNACMEAAQDGLLPDDKLGALVSYKGRVKWMVMTRGLVKLAAKTGKVATTDSLVIYENDSYNSWHDEDGPHFRFSRAIKDRGKPILTMAYLKTTSGELYIEEIDEQQMAEIEKCAKASNVWQGPFRDEMRRKSAFRRLSKRIDLGEEFERVIERDDEDFDFTNHAKQERKQPRLNQLLELTDNKVEEQNPVNPDADDC